MTGRNTHGGSHATPLSMGHRYEWAGSLEELAERNDEVRDAWQQEGELAADVDTLRALLLFWVRARRFTTSSVRETPDGWVVTDELSAHDLRWVNALLDAIRAGLRDA